MGNGKIKCYKFDFGDQPLILQSTDPLHALIDIMGEDGGEHPLTYEVLYLDRAEISALPEWGN